MKAYRALQASHVACLLAGLLCNTACQSTPDAMQSATIASLTPSQLQHVEEILGHAVGQERVPISRDAFATTHILVLEPAARQTPLGTVASGTTTKRPRTFHLLGNAEQCLLEDQATGTRYKLPFACGRGH